MMNTIKRLHKNQSEGFTIIELMIAITIFSVVLLAAGATLTQISRLYYKGVITNKTQNISRSLIDEISQNLQFSSGVVNSATNGQTQSVCIGSTRYTFVLNKQIKQGDSRTLHALWRDKISGVGSCGDNQPNLSDENPVGDEGKELLETGMRLKSLSVTDTGRNEIYSITVGVMHGDDDLINFTSPGSPKDCKGDITGSQWCALSELTTQIYSRVRVH